jgi:hypothetical protein
MPHGQKKHEEVEPFPAANAPAYVEPEAPPPVGSIHGPGGSAQRAAAIFKGQFDEGPSAKNLVGTKHLLDEPPWKPSVPGLTPAPGKEAFAPGSQESHGFAPRQEKSEFEPKPQGEPKPRHWSLLDSFLSFLRPDGQSGQQFHKDLRERGAKGLWDFATTQDKTLPSPAEESGEDREEMNPEMKKKGLSKSGEWDFF